MGNKQHSPLVKPVDPGEFEETPPDRVCLCHCVSVATIERAIDEGAITLEAIREKTRANTGCGGCELDVQEILDRKLAALPRKP